MTIRVSMGNPAFMENDFDKRKLIIHQLQRNESEQRERAIREFIRGHLTENCTWLIVLTTLSHPVTLIFVAITGGATYTSTGSTLCALTSLVVFVVAVYARLRVHAWMQANTPIGEIDRSSTHFTRKGYGLWLAVYGDDFVGTVAVDRRRYDSAVVKYLCVHNDFRRIGVGDRLIQAALRFCREQRYKNLSSTVTALEFPSQRLLKKHGFQKADEDVYMTVLPFVTLNRTHLTLSLKL